MLGQALAEVDGVLAAGGVRRDAVSVLTCDAAVGAVQRVRRAHLSEKPGIAETLDWVRALHRMDFKALPDDPLAIQPTLACLLKTRDDRFQVDELRVRQLIEGRRSVGVAEKTAQAT